MPHCRMMQNVMADVATSYRMMPHDVTLCVLSLHTMSHDATLCEMLPPAVASRSMPRDAHTMSHDVVDRLHMMSHDDVT
eukprot:gene6941-biopygen15007